MKDHDSDNIVKVDSAYDEKSCCHRFLSIDRHNRYHSKVIIESDYWFSHIRFYRLH